MTSDSMRVGAPHRHHFVVKGAMFAVVAYAMISLVNSARAEEISAIESQYAATRLYDYITLRSERYSFDLDKPVQLHFTLDKIEGNGIYIEYIDYIYELYHKLAGFGSVKSEQVLNISIGRGILEAVKTEELSVQFPKEAKNSIKEQDYCYGEASLHGDSDRYKTVIVVFDPSIGGSFADCIHLFLAKSFGFSQSFKQYLENGNPNRDRIFSPEYIDHLQLEAVTVRFRCETFLAQRHKFRACVEREIEKNGVGRSR